MQAQAPVEEEVEAQVVESEEEVVHRSNPRRT